MKFLLKTLGVTITIFGVIMLFCSDSIFEIISFLPNVHSCVGGCFNRIILFVLLWLVVIVKRCMSDKFEIKGCNYTIVVKYGDLFKEKNAKKVISFDEIFTTTVGNRVEDVRETSVCGQFLTKYSDYDVLSKIKDAKLIPTEISKYKNTPCFESGTIIDGEEFLLLAFSKLNSVGRAEMTYSEFKKSLDLMWHNINLYYGQKDVCMPVLGARIVNFKDVDMSAQELLDVIIASYKMSREKIRKPNKLIIECRREEIKLNKIGTFI